MNWIRENWFWIVVTVLFIWMHSKMHGSHGSAGHGREGHEGGGGCGGHRHGDQRDEEREPPARQEGGSHAQH